MYTDSCSRKRICSDCSPQRSLINNQYKTKAAEEKKKKKRNKAAGKRQDRAQTHQPWRSSCRWNLMQEERDTVEKSERETKRAKAQKGTKLCRGTSFSLTLSVGWFVSTQRSLTLHKFLQARSDEYWKCSPVLDFSSNGSTASGCVCVCNLIFFFLFWGCLPLSSGSSLISQQIGVYLAVHSHLSLWLPLYPLGIFLFLAFYFTREWGCRSVFFFN